MVDVTSFLLRWLYLSNLVRRIDEIQMYPYIQNGNENEYRAEPMHYPLNDPISAHPPYRENYVGGTNQGSSFMDSVGPYTQPHPYQRQIPQYKGSEIKWQDDYLREIQSYPPGDQRRYILDALRIKVVQRLAQHLRKTDDTLKKYSSYCHQKDNSLKSDCDTEIMKISNFLNDANSKEAILEVSEDGIITVDDAIQNSIDSEEEELTESEVPSEDELNDAYISMSKFRDYLPQLVSAVLSSPKLSPAVACAVQRFRSLLLTRCLQDPDWGIELCWLLEAEVGRGWQKFFQEHRRTGARLILVMPADRAYAISIIGNQKREAFDLLQDVEHATAYGDTGIQNVDFDLEPCPAYLPSSLKRRRCSHFADAMQFIDRLSQISFDLRKIPVIGRRQFLLSRLEDINYRLRRRMATRGDLSIDVEDQRFDNAEDQRFDKVYEVSADMLKYSVHLPLEPKRMTWPGGEIYGTSNVGSAAERSRTGVMRVLNIISSECRLLSSRDRCPYLVHLEVAETGMEGSDARLYASGDKRLGTTIGESVFPGTKIPNELLIKPRRLIRPISREKNMQMFEGRGGSQYDEFYPEGGFGPTPYDTVRQTQYEQLYQDISPPTSSQITDTPSNASTKSALLDRVFGPLWSRKCEEIRQASPFKNVKGWRLASFIMKAGEDIRKEALVMQIIAKLNEWFETDIPVDYQPKMRPYTIMCVGGDAGLLECLSDAKSVDELKKKTDGFTTLRRYFERAYGPPAQNFQSRNDNFQAGQKDTKFSGDGSNLTFEEAQDNFLRSLVGYSLVCYILKIKDRHNANILIDRWGHVIHIDFGFVLGETPKMGKIPIFSEWAPFKLSPEFWEVLGGWNVKCGLGVKFCKMFEKAFECASSHKEEIASLVEAAILNLTKSPSKARLLANEIIDRLKMRGPRDSRAQKEFIRDLVVAAEKSKSHTTYDWLQKNMNGYQ